MKIDETDEGEETPENSKIEYVEELLGFAVLNISEFVEKKELKNMAKKYQIFEYSDPSIFKNHELLWPLSQEKQIISKSTDKINKLRAEKYEPKEVKNIDFKFRRKKMSLKLLEKELEQNQKLKNLFLLEVRKQHQLNLRLQ